MITNSLPISSALMCLAAIVGWSQVASAQELSSFLQSEMPFDENRDRNVSVTDRLRPEYQAPGLYAGGFTIFPSITTGIGATDNVYSVSNNKTRDAFLTVNPAVRVNSNWSRNRLTARAGGRFLRYLDETRKDEDGWYAGVEGRYDIGVNYSIAGQAQTARLYESRFSAASVQNVASSAPYQETDLRLIGQVARGRLRIALATDFASFDFKPVEVLGGITVSQNNRDRDIWRASMRSDYAISPSASVYGQLSYIKTSYDNPLAAGVANRDADGFRALAGISMDVTALIRGRFGIGYVHRNYDSPTFEDFGGFSVEGQLEYFITELTTIGLVVKRNIEDSNVTGSSGYFNTGGSVTLDHELLRNLLLNLNVSYERADYRGIDAEVDVFRVGAGARYLLSPTMALGFNFSHGSRNNHGLTTGPDFSENRGILSFTLQR